MPSKLVFLPGVSGNTRFWHPVADRLSHLGQRLHIGWPGFGETPSHPAVSGLSDLVDLVIKEIDRPTVLFAQSMGGVIAIRAALQKPELITHLILSVTSGGIDFSSFGATDWRPPFHAANPGFPDWFDNEGEDLASRLKEIKIPALLLWGDQDPISPVAVGQRLAVLLPDSRLHVIPGGGHDLANAMATTVVPLIENFLQHDSI